MLTIHVRYNNHQTARKCAVCGEAHFPPVGFAAFVANSNATVCEGCVESADEAFFGRMKSLWRELEDQPFHLITGRNLITMVSPHLRLLPHLVSVRAPVEV